MNFLRLEKDVMQLWRIIAEIILNLDLLNFPGFTKLVSSQSRARNFLSLNDNLFLCVPA